MSSNGGPATTQAELWKPKHLWSRRHKTFMVEVSQHFVEPPESSCYDDKGVNRWCVYAYIYPDHPRYSQFTSEQIWQPATEDLPLHGGCTFCRLWPGSKERASAGSYQVGGDYDHLHDGRFTRMDTADEAIEVFNDADSLFDFLKREAEAARTPSSDRNGEETR